MPLLKRAFGILVILIIVWAVGALNVAADVDTPLVIDSQVLLATQVAPAQASAQLVIQAISMAGTTNSYLLTISNLTPWDIPDLHVVDRYLPEQADQAEKITIWAPGKLTSGGATATVIALPEDMPGACHQLEISLATGLGFVLMDCGGAGSSVVWEVPLAEGLLAPYQEPEPITQPVASGPSKLGIHVTRNSSPEIMEFVEQAQPAVVAAVGDLGWLADVKARSPRTVTLGRLIESDQSIAGDPIQRARAFVDAHMSYYHANPGVDYWLGWNEPVIDEVWQAEWYAAFESERVALMSAAGFKTAIGNFSAGTPEPAEFEAFVPAIEVAKQHGAILAVHEYSAPTMLDGVGAGIPGLEAMESRGALTLRYRFWYHNYLIPRDLVIPLVVSETGIDGGVLRLPDTRLLGWRDFERGERLPEMMASSSSQAYLEQISWYDDRLREDEYAIGFAVFNVGEPDGMWASFDMTDLLPEMTGISRTKP